jgi:hypothetical protein
MKHFKQVAGFGEIKKLDKQIVDAMELMDKMLAPLIKQILNPPIPNPKKHTPQIYESDLYNKLLKYENKFKRLGFYPCHSTGVTFIGHRQVIKLAYNVSSIPSKSHRIPTMVYHYDTDCWKQYQYFLTIQPKVKVIGEDNESIYKCPRAIDERYVDSHYDNLCVYGGKILLLDW